MNKYVVALTRTYEVEIEAESAYDAKEYVEWYVSGEEDKSSEKDREEKKFRILDIDCTWNQALSVSNEETDELIEF